MPSAALLEAVAVTAELCGRTFSEPAARVFVSDLSAYPERQVIAALTRCRKECRGLLTIADVVSRLDDGRPGVEEAWAMLPKSESDTAVWTDEMRQAFGIAGPLLEQDPIAARMAFKESYLALVAKARDAGRPVEWTATLGHDAGARDGALLLAVEHGRLTLERAREYAPMLPAPKADLLAMVGDAVKRLPA
jgi:hypothetical protein